ncbi:hypothetical protein [Erwinia sp.]|uniref:hypothetical protein n=1 Tax=Erwinia citreus TaxID=558 RepID=UPI00289CDDFD|nr:hypothetical protein [Erwinia sp.]
MILDKPLLTTLFKALYNGFAKEIKIHIKPTFTESLKSCIEEAGEIFRAVLSLLLYFVRNNKITFLDLDFNENAQNNPSRPSISKDNIKKSISICENIYFYILVEIL